MERGQTFWNATSADRVDAERIVPAFLVAPKTMGQRLVRVKAKILDAGIRFEIPDLSELPRRLRRIE